jgi:hypothetical protein
MLFSIMTPLSASPASMEGVVFEDNFSLCGTISSSTFSLEGTRFTLKFVDRGDESIAIYGYQNDQLMHRVLISPNHSDRMYITTFTTTARGGALLLEASEEVFIFSDFGIEAAAEYVISPFGDTINGGSGGRFMGTANFSQTWANLHLRLNVRYAAGLSARSTLTIPSTAQTIAW